MQFVFAVGNNQGNDEAAHAPEEKCGVSHERCEINGGALVPSTRARVNTPPTHDPLRLLREMTISAQTKKDT